MNEIIAVENHGPLLARSNYWASKMAAAGYYYISPNAGVLRLLVPAPRAADLREMRTAKEIIVRLGPDRRHADRPMAEFLFDDRTQNPFVLYFSDEQWERLPAEGDFPRPIEITVWEARRGTPHRVLSRPGWLDRAALPCLAPLAQSNR